MNQTECDLIRPSLSAYLDGETDAAESEAIRRHEAACPACRQALAELRETVRLTRNAGASVPPEVLTRVRLTVKVDSRMRTIRVWLRAASATAAVFFMAAALFLFTRLPMADQNRGDEAAPSHESSNVVPPVGSNSLHEPTDGQPTQSPFQVDSEAGTVSLDGLTFFFTDLVASDRLSPTELREVARQLETACHDPVQRQAAADYLLEAAG